VGRGNGVNLGVGGGGRPKVDVSRGLLEDPSCGRVGRGCGVIRGRGLGVGGPKVDISRGVLGEPRGSAGGATQTTPTPKKKSKQRTGQKRDRVGVIFRFGIMEPPVCLTLVSS
jgi:hypothetical protein